MFDARPVQDLNEGYMQSYKMTMLMLLPPIQHERKGLPKSLDNILGRNQERAMRGQKSRFPNDAGIDRQEGRTHNKSQVILPKVVSASIISFPKSASKSITGLFKGIIRSKSGLRESVCGPEGIGESRPVRCQGNPHEEFLCVCQ
ncbi:hypothetical protein EJB05_48929, partial [Eragrostis curvula]